MTVLGGIAKQSSNPIGDKLKSFLSGGPGCTPPFGGQDPIKQLVDKLSGALAQFGGKCRPPVPADALKQLFGEEGLKNLSPEAKKAVGEALKGLHISGEAKKMLADAGIPGFEKKCGEGQGCTDRFENKTKQGGLLGRTGSLNPGQAAQQLGQLLGALGELPPPVSLSALAPLRLS